MICWAKHVISGCFCRWRSYVSVANRSFFSKRKMWQRTFNGDCSPTSEETLNFAKTGGKWRKMRTRRRNANWISSSVTVGFKSRLPGNELGAARLFMFWLQADAEFLINLLWIHYSVLCMTSVSDCPPLSSGHSKNILLGILGISAISMTRGRHSQTLLTLDYVRCSDAFLLHVQREAGERRRMEIFALG